MMTRRVEAATILLADVVGLQTNKARNPVCLAATGNRAVVSFPK